MRVTAEKPCGVLPRPSPPREISSDCAGTTEGVSRDPGYKTVAVTHEEADMVACAIERGSKGVNAANRRGQDLS